MSTQNINNDIQMVLKDLEPTISAIKQLPDSVVNKKKADIFDVSAAAFLLSTTYYGIENILKKICRDKRVNLPKGESAHIQLFKMFCEGNSFELPALFTDEIAEPFTYLRRIRHYENYSYHLDWDTMVAYMNSIAQLMNSFIANLERYFTENSITKFKD